MTGTAIQTVEKDGFDVGERPVVSLTTFARPVEVATIEDARAAIAARNETEIMRAAEGEMISEWIYEFKVAGKVVTGLGATGAMEVARIRAEQGFPIQFREVETFETIQNGERGIRCIVRTRELRTGGEGLGMAFYPYYEKRKDGPDVADRYADRKALSVAKRNAILDLIPEVQVLALLKHRQSLIAKNEKRANEVQAQASAAPRAIAKPPVAPTPTALKKSAEVDTAAAASVAGVDAGGFAKPIPGDTTPATQPQIDKLIAFAESPTIADDVRDKILVAVDGGISQDLAAKWITRLTELARAAIAKR